MILDGEGTMLPGWPRNLSSGIIASPAIGQMDGEGGLEIVAVGGTQYRSKVGVFKANGDSYSTDWTVTLETGIDSSPALGDLWGDEDLEIVIGGLDGKLYAWDLQAQTGNFPIQFSHPESIHSSPAIGDVVEADGELEIVIASQYMGGTPPYEHFRSMLYAVRGNGEILHNWPVSISYLSFDSQAAAGSVIWDDGRVPAAKISIK